MLITYRIGYWLSALLGLVGLAIAWWQLLLPTQPLRIERQWLGATPVTIYRGGMEPAPAIVVAHGFAGSQQIMDSFAVTLARGGFTTLTFDFPGHGQNTTPLQGDITDRERRHAQLSATLDAVVALARQQGDGRVGLLGHSMGSEAVVRYAQAHPAIAGTVAVSLGYGGVTPASPRNLLVLTGALEPQLHGPAQRIADQAAGGQGQTGVTYGSLADGNARRVVYPPFVEHIGVLFSPVSMDESLRWFNGVFERPQPQAPFLDMRLLWLVLLFVSATVLFWPLSLIVDCRLQIADWTSGHAPGWGWWLVALLPALLAPLLLRLFPADGLLPILVGGPLALYFALYGVASGLGLLALRLRRGQQQAAPVPRPQAARPATWWRALRLRLPVIVAAALLMFGYVLLMFGLPAHMFLLNYFPPPVRLPIFGAVFGAMLPYFLADEWLTRRAGGLRGAYAITKVIFMFSLALAIALNPRLFFLVLIAPLFLIYFSIYGLFSGVLTRRSGTPLVGALANAAIFAWIVAAIFPLIAVG
ncbi:MAG: lysophospholipase [Chloroflexaceae bacterium]|jgi:pimeloyl-ACP methyl ester carboxylesterase|nr:lysophospholipase [Chloroflexaceae bacterium]